MSCRSPAGLVLEINVGQRLAGVILHDKAGGVLLLDDPRRREAALRHLLQSSSASRVTAGAAGFLTFSQQSARPARYGEPRRFDTMPSQPSEQSAAITIPFGLSLWLGRSRCGRTSAVRFILSDSCLTPNKKHHDVRR